MGLTEVLNVDLEILLFPLLEVIVLTVTDFRLDRICKLISVMCEESFGFSFDILDQDSDFLNLILDNL